MIVSPCLAYKPSDDKSSSGISSEVISIGKSDRLKQTVLSLIFKPSISLTVALINVLMFLTSTSVISVFVTNGLH